MRLTMTQGGANCRRCTFVVHPEREADDEESRPYSYGNGAQHNDGANSGAPDVAPSDFENHERMLSIGFNFRIFTTAYKLTNTPIKKIMVP